MFWGNESKGAVYNNKFNFSEEKTHEKIADCQTVALKLHIWKVLKILMNAQKGLSLMETNSISGLIIEISISAEALPLVYFILFQILQNWQWELWKNVSGMAEHCQPPPAVRMSKNIMKEHFEKSHVIILL